MHLRLTVRGAGENNVATFKVGQRVRITTDGGLPQCKAGAEGTIKTLNLRTEAPWGMCHAVVVDGVHSWHVSGCWCIPIIFLAPLTDPKTDAFIESLKKLGREPKPLEVVETLSHRSPLVWSDK